MGRRYVKLERNQASIIQGNYSCARCWTPVLVCHDKTGDYISCGEDDCRCEGLIKTSSVEYLIRKNDVLAIEARRVLEPQFEWLKKPKKKHLSIEENIKELGF